jgi:hypothetical protein
LAQAFENACGSDGQRMRERLKLFDVGKIIKSPPPRKKISA